LQKIDRLLRIRGVEVHRCGAGEIFEGSDCVTEEGFIVKGCFECREAKALGLTGKDNGVADLVERSHVFGRQGTGFREEVKVLTHT
jgi:hypothetical protein